jgi:hypothetical protein
VGGGVSGSSVRKAVVGGRIVEQDHARQPPDLGVADRSGDDLVKDRLVDGREEARDVEPERKPLPSSVGGLATQHPHERVARRQRALALSARVGVVDETALEQRLLA